MHGRDGAAEQGIANLSLRQATQPIERKNIDGIIGKSGTRGCRVD